ncbi:MAG: flagellar biosynthesis regulator FlaF [Pseudomonadota bacterium]
MAYASPGAPVRTPRGNEAEAFAQVTRAMKIAQAGGPSAHPKLVQALHQNGRLWTLLAASVADPANALPKQLRAQIFYLAEFTGKHTAEVLRGKADATELIDLNSIMMKALRERDATDASKKVGAV